MYFWQRGIADNLKRLRFRNKKFWNERYLRDPEKGSGPGSRGGNMLLKKEAIEKVVNAYRIESILDIGCGDVSSIQKLGNIQYVGVDISEMVISRNKDKRKDLHFICADVLADCQLRSADLVMSLDV